MSRANLARFLVHLVGASLFVAAFLRWRWSVTGVAAMIGVWFAASLVAAWAGRRVASGTDRRADPESRMRDPPP